MKRILIATLLFQTVLILAPAQQKAIPKEEIHSPPVKTVRVTEGTDIAATISPDQGTIVFDLQGVLWSLPFHGGAAKRLTDPFLEPARPDYSPKGGSIVFQSYKGGTFHIWTIQADGKGLRQLTDGHGDDREPRFSPDGLKVAFASDRAFKGSYDIWVADVATGKLTQWTSSAKDEFEPAWSPDGSEIAFVSGEGANGTTIQAVNAQGALRTVVTAPAGARVNSPSWSPDGKKIAYTQIEGAKTRLFVSGARVGNGDDVFPFHPTWLSANQILYTGDGKIRVVSLDRNETVDIPFEAQFTLNRPAYQHRHFDLDSQITKPAKGIVSPALSPDGKQVLFEALNQLWILDIGKGKPHALTNDAFYKADPSWSPDGKRIAYSSDKNGIEALYILNLETKQEKRVIASDDSAELSSAWSRDGKSLAFQDQTGTTYTVEIEKGQKRKIIDRQFEPAKPTWLANGQAVSIGAVKPYTRRFREGTSQILTVNLASGALTFSEPAPFKSLSTRGEDGPVYSPDGTSVAFVSESVLWVRPVDANGVPSGPAKQLTSEATDAPTWSGDSKTLLYLANGKLRLIGTDGTSLRAVPRAVTRDIPLDLTWHNEAAQPQQILIRAGHLWDGRGADVQTDVDIIVTGHRIQSIAPHSDAVQRQVAANNGRIIDASQLTVIPGLWESHTHEWMSGRSYGSRLGRLWLAYGFTELKSQGDPAYRAAETREAYGSGERVGPRFFTTGEAIDGERVYYNFMRPTTSEEQLQRELSRAQALEYDSVKTYVRLPHEKQEEVTKFAHDKLGVTVASHYMLPGTGFGVDGISHISATARTGYAYTRSAGGITYNDARSIFIASGQYVISTPFGSGVLYGEDPAMVEDSRLLLLNTPWDQTVLRGKLRSALGQSSGSALGVGDSNAQLLERLRNEEATIASILNGGGVVLAGTDSPIDSVATAMHLNLRSQVKFGRQPWQALQTATLLPARAFGVEKDLGTVEAGKLADLVLVAGDPLHEIKDVAKVQSVMKGGRLYSIAELTAPFSKK